MISGLAASIECPERGASCYIHVRPCLNSFIQLYTVANADADVMNIIQLDFDFFRR